MIEKIILGTVQFGLEYGINNTLGMMSSSEVSEVLELAHNSGIRSLDTASAYGKSEERIGNYIQKNGKSDFRIITKFNKGGTSSWESSVQKSIQLLHVNKVDTILFHSYEEYFCNKEILPRIIEQGKNIYFDKLGVSIYTNEELYKTIEDPYIEVIQIPFNVLDNHYLRSEALIKAKKLGKTIITRSVFLQGLFFMPLDKIPLKLVKLTPYIEQIHQLAEEEGLPIQTIALQYALSKEYIDGVLIGVDSKQQLEENIKSIKSGISDSTISKIDEIQIKDINLLNISKW